MSADIQRNRIHETGMSSSEGILVDSVWKSAFLQFAVLQQAIEFIYACVSF